MSSWGEKYGKGALGGLNKAARVAMMRQVQRTILKESIIVSVILILLSGITILLAPWPPVLEFYLALVIWFMVNGIVLAKKELPADHEVGKHKLLLISVAWSPVLLVMVVFGMGQNKTTENLIGACGLLATLCLAFMFYVYLRGKHMESLSFPKSLPDEEDRVRFESLVKHIKTSNHNQDPELVRFRAKQPAEEYWLKPVENHVFLYAKSEKKIAFIPMEQLSMNAGRSVGDTAKIKSITNPSAETDAGLKIANDHVLAGSVTYRDLEKFNAWIKACSNAE